MLITHDLGVVSEMAHRVADSLRQSAPRRKANRNDIWIFRTWTARADIVDGAIVTG